LCYICLHCIHKYIWYQVNYALGPGAFRRSEPTIRFALILICPLSKEFGIFQLIKPQSPQPNWFSRFISTKRFIKADDSAAGAVGSVFAVMESGTSSVSIIELLKI
jgi:hypothetical protein